MAFLADSRDSIVLTVVSDQPQSAPMRSATSVAGSGSSLLHRVFITSSSASLIRMTTTFVDLTTTIVNSPAAEGAKTVGFSYDAGIRSRLLMCENGCFQPFQQFGTAIATLSASTWFHANEGAVAAVLWSPASAPSSFQASAPRSCRSSPLSNIS